MNRFPSELEPCAHPEALPGRQQWPLKKLTTYRNFFPFALLNFGGFHYTGTRNSVLCPRSVFFLGNVVPTQRILGVSAMLLAAFGQLSDTMFAVKILKNFRNS